MAKKDVLQGTLALLVLKTLAARGAAARFYRVTAAGRRALVEEEAGWKRLVEGVQRVLRHA